MSDIEEIIDLYAEIHSDKYVTDKLPPSIVYNQLLNLKEEPYFFRTNYGRR